MVFSSSYLLDYLLLVAVYGGPGLRLVCAPGLCGHFHLILFGSINDHHGSIQFGSGTYHDLELSP